MFASQVMLVLLSLVNGIDDSVTQVHSGVRACVVLRVAFHVVLEGDQLESHHLLGPNVNANRYQLEPGQMLLVSFLHLGTTKSVEESSFRGSPFWCSFCWMLRSR